MIYLDTHVVAWLYGGGRTAVPGTVAERLERTDDIRISPMVRLELQYLFEIGRVATPALPVVDAMETALGLTICRASFAAVVREAESRTWTRDPFDRLIVSQAALFDAPLITKDQTIHDNYRYAAWE